MSNQGSKQAILIVNWQLFIKAHCPKKIKEVLNCIMHLCMSYLGGIHLTMDGKKEPRFNKGLLANRYNAFLDKVFSEDAIIGPAISRCRKASVTEVALVMCMIAEQIFELI